MPNFLPDDIHQSVFLDVNFLEVLGTNTFEYSLYCLLNRKNILEAFDKKYKDGLHALDVEYASQIAKAREAKEAEIEALKNKAAEDAEKAAEKLTEEQRAHEKTRVDLECRIATLLVRKFKQ